VSNECLFDNITRILASSMPRRASLRIMGSVLLGAGLAGLGFPRRALADVTCKTGSICPTLAQCLPQGGCCPTRQVACPTNACCDTLAQCLPLPGGINGCCPTGQVACPTNACCNTLAQCLPPGGINPCCPNATKEKPAQVACPSGSCCDTLAECLPQGGCCPTCPQNTTSQISAIRSAPPPTQADVTVQNAVVGVSLIDKLTLVNCTVPNLPMNTGGTTSPIVVTATKIDETQTARIKLDVCTPDGCCCPGDPVFATLKITTGKWVRQTFTELPQQEHFITVTNDYFGLRQLRITINGAPYATLRLANGETRNINVNSAMIAGSKNTISVVGVGDLGATAGFAILDSAPTAASANVARPIAAKVQGKSSHVNPNWGPLSEEVEDTAIFTRRSSRRSRSISCSRAR
jgi:hypothetical protein